ncbi:hypothetical protein CEXT_654571 [Caerostris extrusa]|uniref:Uncharacterized protein n=1 Tax=Caerostris extrusa TaxID=172846 RepID=A0AAV4PK22_CAEEX|nr:hypothetical protein CEXT_654571 [Caerostris extrusa]
MKRWGGCSVKRLRLERRERELTPSSYNRGDHQEFVKGGLMKKKKRRGIHFERKVSFLVIVVIESYSGNDRSGSREEKWGIFPLHSIENPLRKGKVVLLMGWWS